MKHIKFLLAVGILFAGLFLDPIYLLGSIAFVPISNIVGISLGTVAAGIGTATPFTIQYVPQFIRFLTTAAPAVSMKIQGDATLVDLDAAGVTIIQTWRKFGAFTNEYIIPLANGLIKDRTVTITITNQTAATFSLDAHSSRTLPKDLTNFVGYGSTQVLVGGSRFSKFAALYMPNLGATDTFNIWMNDGTQDTLTRDEIRARLQYTQNPVVTSTYIWDNTLGDTSEVQLLPAASQTIYWAKYFKAYSNEKINTSIQQQ